MLMPIVDGKALKATLEEGFQEAGYRSAWQVCVQFIRGVCGHGGMVHFFLRPIQIPVDVSIIVLSWEFTDGHPYMPPRVVSTLPSNFGWVASALIRRTRVGPQSVDLLEAFYHTMYQSLRLLFGRHTCLWLGILSPHHNSDHNVQEPCPRDHGASLLADPRFY